MTHLDFIDLQNTYKRADETYKTARETFKIEHTAYTKGAQSNASFGDYLAAAKIFAKESKDYEKISTVYARLSALYGQKWCLND